MGNRYTFMGDDTALVIFVPPLILATFKENNCVKDKQ